MAHAYGVPVEGELGVLGSLQTGMDDQEDGHGVTEKLGHDQLLTNPAEAERFVAETGVDALALTMCASHGTYKFTRKPDGAVLARHVIEKIHRCLPNTYLVMHGSASVPEDLQAILNNCGGDIKPTWGVPVEEIERGIRSSVHEVNIDTDNCLAMTAAIRKTLAEDPTEFDPRKYLNPAMALMQNVCPQRFEAFGTAGNAGRIGPLPVEAMAKRY